MKKMLALTMALLMILVCLAGCGKKEDKAEANSRYDKIIESGELHVSLSPDFAPMEFVDTSKSGQDQYVGFDVTLAKAIADKWGVELIIEPMSFEACQAAVSTGNVDMSISGYSVTPEREENFNLSDGYYTGNEENQVIVALKDTAATLTSPEAFAGKLVSAQNASLQWNLLTEQLPDAEANMIADLGVAVLEVVNGQVDALCCAKGQADIFLAANPELAICPWEFTIEDDSNVILIQKGEDELLEEVNKILAELLESGVYAEWYNEANELAQSEFAADVTIPDEE